MTVFYFLLFLYTSFTVSDAKRFRYDYTYNSETEGWLKLHEIPANWNDARVRCHNEESNANDNLNNVISCNNERVMNNATGSTIMAPWTSRTDKISTENAVLASPTDERMNAAMTSLMANLPSCGVFTGIHAYFSRGYFLSIEGVPIAKIPIRWAPGEPDNYENNENCLVLLKDGTMADVNCSDIFPYLCYKKKTQNVVITDCGTVDNGYQLDRRTGSCYKFHHEPKNWWKAYAICAAEGGYLAIINNATEAQVIKDLFVKNPPDAIIGKFAKHVAHIGFHDWGEHGSWLTVHGQTLEQAGYTRFDKEQPDNMLTREFCGSIFQNGLLNDITCERQSLFICEKSQDSLYSVEEY